MSRRAFDLPPLELLVAFEAAARHLSFTRAADEIALTQSAVSRQIQSLESHPGVALFRRLHRSLALTEEGRAFFQSASSALADLDAATQALRRSGETRTVVVTTTPGFAGLWLIPRLSSFVAANPGVDVRISAANALAHLERDGVDVAVRYQAIDAGSRSSRLFGETVYPVCSPKLLRAAGTPLKVPGELVASDLAAHGARRRQPVAGLEPLAACDEAGRAAACRRDALSSYDQLIHAAVAGQGIAVGRLPLIDQLVRARKLVAPFAGAVVSPRGYCVIVAAQAEGRPEVAAFTAWLTASARGPDSARPQGRARP